MDGVLALGVAMRSCRSSGSRMSSQASCLSVRLWAGRRVRPPVQARPSTVGNLPDVIVHTYECSLLATIATVHQYHNTVTTLYQLPNTPAHTTLLPP
jgi:hypothetical protein